MTLRPELTPNIQRAEKLFPKVLELISQYDSAFDQEDKHTKQLVLKELNSLTKKNLENHDLFEYWSYISKEDLAFKFSLPAPKKVDTITEEEIKEIQNRITSLENADKALHEKLSTFLFSHGVIISYILVDAYYHPLLELNDPSSSSDVICL
ncbi:conserved protein of unknown function [Tenacibaculum sp. 190130A14a]|uniref:Uncharacterized protein n=1 Tax=Tenacibaculum polynesiense TaxID=3137857 RepID=A0ABM9PE29_9FLAO